MNYSKTSRNLLFERVGVFIKNILSVNLTLQQQLVCFQCVRRGGRDSSCCGIFIIFHARLDAHGCLRCTSVCLLHSNENNSLLKMQIFTSD